jgi:glutamate-5-semialdehyde dehydrogenase
VSTLAGSAAQSQQARSDAADADVRGLAVAARRAARVLASTDAATRNRALHAMADALVEAGPELFQANQADLAAADALDPTEALPEATRARLELSAAKLQEMVAQVRSVAALPDPLGRKLDAIELDDEGPQTTRNGQSKGLYPDAQSGLYLEKLTVPLGVLAVIFEARPDAVTQIAALALKSGNAVLMKPGSEVERTAAALVRVLRSALSTVGLAADGIALVHGRRQVAELLAAHDLVDMVIPRGSKALVEYVQANTRIPVLGHSEGICHIYVDRSADQDRAIRIIDDAKTDYPAACNAVETVLVDRAIAAEFLPRLAEHLRSRGIRLHGDATVRALLRGVEIDAVTDWHTEYGELALSLGVVDSVDAAIEHIHTHGSSHTESILTEDEGTAERFLREVDAATVLHNASTRFADGFRYGFGAEVGISTSKFHARGPVGLEGLTTYKYVLRGHGHIAGDYRGEHARAFTHRRPGEAR